MKYFGFFIIGLLFIGCGYPDEKKIFFGGEIINPKSDIVILMQNEKIIDSILLNPDHTFGKYISNLKTGLYYFKHAYEFQYLFLEPDDSISIRLNTWDFDETLVFDGQGADKNELLLDLFLNNEKETGNFFTYFALDETAFQIKIDEIFTRHTTLLEQLEQSNKELSDDFLHLAEGAINYPIYRLKELYPFYHKKSLPKDSVFDLSANYYNYRDDVDLNDSLLSSYYGYQNYVSAYLYNLAYQKNDFKGFDDDFRHILFQLITEKIHLPELKNRLLYQEINTMLFSGDCKVQSKQLNLFYSNSTDTLAIEKIKQILKAKEELKVSSRLKNFDLISIKHDTLSIKDLIKGTNAVVYFIPSSFDAGEYLAKRVFYLKRKYPQLLFIGIHQENTVNRISNKISSKLGNQYYLTKNSDGNELITSNFPRAILIDSNGEVVNNFTILTNRQIEKQLSNLLN